MKMPFEKLDDIVKVKVYYGDNRASGSEYVQIKFTVLRMPYNHYHFWIYIK